MDTQELLERLVRAGFTDVASARQALDAVLGALVRCGEGPELRALLAALPAELRLSLGTPPAHGRFDSDAFYACVAELEDLGPGPGLEHAQMICRELGLLLEPEARASLGRALSRELFEAPRYTPPIQPRDGGPVRAAHDLASGRPGSHRPLAEAAPPGPQSGSVAEKNPHHDSKLSSATGLTQEALHEDLATGKPRGKPVSDG